MQAKQEPSDPASSPEVTLVVEALIWQKKGRWGRNAVALRGGDGGGGATMIKEVWSKEGILLDNCKIRY